MSKFNLVNYKKSDPDAHISRQLEDQRSEAPDSITEKQLEKDRVTERNSTLEAQLEAVRQGSADSIIERNLNTSKGRFSKLRNESAFKGNISKLEEKRIKGSKMEDETYEAAAQTPKDMRWWDDLVPKASKTAKGMPNLNRKISAQGALDELDFSDQASMERAKDIWGEEGELETVEDKTPDMGAEEMMEAVDEATQAQPSQNKEMYLIKNKEFTSPMPAIHMKFGFDPEAFNGDIDEIKEAALEKVLSIRPSLDGLISTEDFDNPQIGSFDGTINLRLIGEEYLKANNNRPMFEEISIEEADAGGTPVIVGRIKVNMRLEDMDQGEIARDIVEFVTHRNPDIELSPDALDFSDIDSGEVKFVALSKNKADLDITEISSGEGDVTPDAEPLEENTDLAEEMANEQIHNRPPSVASSMDFPVFEIKTSDTKKKTIAE